MIGLLSKGLVSLVLAGSLVLTPASSELAPIPVVSLISVANAPLIGDPFSGFPTLRKICTCESGLSHFEDDGSVLRGKINQDDVGICQINEYYHEKRIKRLSVDIYSKDGNIEFAKDLYRRHGTKPWNASKACWKA